MITYFSFNATSAPVPLLDTATVPSSKLHDAAETSDEATSTKGKRLRGNRIVKCDLLF